MPNENSNPPEALNSADATEGLKLEILYENGVQDKDCSSLYEELKGLKPNSASDIINHMLTINTTRHNGDPSTPKIEIDRGTGSLKFPGCPLASIPKQK